MISPPEKNQEEKLNLQIVLSFILLSSYHMSALFQALETPSADKTPPLTVGETVTDAFKN